MKKPSTDFAFAKKNDDMGRFTVRNTRSLGRMDFLLSLVRRAIQSTGTKSAKVKGWRRKMVLLMCPSASRVLTSAPIQLLSDTTSVVVQLLARETKERKSFLTGRKTKITIFPENMGRVTENMYLKSWREAYICSRARREGYENKKFQVFLWPQGSSLLLL